MNTQKTRNRSLWLAVIGLAAGALVWTGAAAADDSPQVQVKVDSKPIVRTAQNSYAPVIREVAPSVVKVMVMERGEAVEMSGLPPFLQDPRFRQFFGENFGQGRQMPAPEQEGLGSGVIVSADGYILTNNHVVKGADEITVTLADRRELRAKVVGTDPQTDLAVIKIDATDLPHITFADSDLAEVGDTVLAIGNPFGIGQTVTSGMVSGLGRASLGLDYEDFIQTDAAINPGNSGGALVDVNGRLLGVNTAILSRTGGFQGIGFAVPANLARNVMEQLVQNGKVVRGYLGVSIQDITSDLAKHFDLKSPSGALVADVSPDSPAAEAGLEAGDIITELDGHEVLDARRLKLMVGSVAPGRELSAKVLRDGKIRQVNIEVGNRPGDLTVANNGDSKLNKGAGDEGSLKGVGVANLDRQLRREFNVPTKIQGALITEVVPNSAAARAGLRPGDVIEEINRNSVKGADDAIRLTETSNEGRTLVRIWNQRGSRYVVVDETADAKGAS